MNLRLHLDTETTLALINDALVEKRPIDWHAEVLLRRALGLPFPAKPKEVPQEELDQAIGAAVVMERHLRKERGKAQTAAD